MLEFKMHEAKMLKEQGKKINEIAQIIGKSDRMVHYYLSEPTRSRKKRVYVSKLDPYKDYIDTILEDDPCFNRVVLFRNLQKQNYDGGLTILRKYSAQKADQVSKKAVIRFETEPAYQAQVDWKELGLQLVDGQYKKLYAFTMVFGYSRAPFVIHTTSMNQATVLACHSLAFSYFGGVPKEVLYDNMKTAFIYSSSEGKWKPNKHLLSLAKHYCFTPRRCQVRRPQTKGKVERFIHYYTHNFWTEFKGHTLNLEALNESVLSWISDINKIKLRGFNASREERFNHEKQFFTPLPRDSFDYRLPVNVRVSRESLICFKTNWYSVPPQNIGKTLTLLEEPLTNLVEVFDEGILVRRFNPEEVKKHQRYYLSQHEKALKLLWENQRFFHKEHKEKKTTVVNVREPSVYDNLFNTAEVAS